MHKTLSAKQSRDNDRSIRIVAIGASAGGLEALEQFFEAVPEDTGVAYVVVQHLSPDFPSMMNEILGRQSAIPVHTAEPGTKIAPNTIYLRPARETLIIRDDTFHHIEDVSQGPVTLPIDVFMISLAEARRKDAIGIILSGTGSDGTNGALAIREVGGTVLVQSPQTARFDSMPRSVSDRNLAHAAAAPGNLPSLINLVLEGKAPPFPEESSTFASVSGPEDEIIRLLHQRLGTDFTHYKKATIGRRIQRRAELSDIRDIGEYLAKLKRDTAELDTLCHDLLIGVTSFFRDAEAFEAVDKLLNEVLPKLMAIDDRQFRIWVPGCATGEEAYSYAILLSEWSRQTGKNLNAKIFATDIHRQALDLAGRATFSPKLIEDQIEPDLRQRYFTRVGSNYRVEPSLRQLVVFSRHDLLRDPPFTRMDLISCRNLLIYFDDKAQQKAMMLFHLALNKGGILCLGSSETTGNMASEYQEIDKRWRIYRKIRDVRLHEALRQMSSTAIPSSSTPHAAPVLQPARLSPRDRADLSAAYDQVLARFGPPGVIVDSNGEIAHIFGEARQFLTFPEGQYSGRLVDSLNRDLGFPVGSGLDQVRHDRSLTFERDVEFIEDNSSRRAVRVTVETLKGQFNPHNDYYLVLFKELRPLPVVENSVERAGAEDNLTRVQRDQYLDRIAHLERDLSTTEESLQATIQETETTNEELQAANEELMSANEELQSTNEELQSVNEELHTVSSEHKHKIEELIEMTADLDLLLTSTKVGVIYLDQELCVRRFTPEITALFNLLDRDIGRPIGQIKPRFKQFDLVAAIEGARDGDQTADYEVDVDDRTFLLRIRPYELGRKQSGYGITSIDITDRHQAEIALENNERRFRATFENAAVGFAHVAPDGKWLLVNSKLCEILGYSVEDLKQKTFLEITPPEDVERSKEFLDRILSGKIEDYVIEKRYIRGDGSLIWVNKSVSCVRRANGETDYLIIVLEDIDSRKQMEEQIEDRNTALERANEQLGQFSYIVGHDLRSPLRAMTNSAQWILEDLGNPASRELQDHVDRMTEHSRRMHDMLDGLIKYSRLALEPSEPDVVTLDELVEEIVRNLGQTKRVIVDVKGPVRTLSATRTALDIVLRNIIDNAIKHSDRDTVTIELSCEEQGSEYVFELTDDGPGIPLRYHDRIFLPFRKVEADNKSSGTGMGLALVRRAIEDHGGRIWVNSDPENRRGTTFFFTWSNQRPRHLQDRR